MTAIDDSADSAADLNLILYNTWNNDEMPFPVVPCSPVRDWVREAGGGPYRCLPLKVAGEAGWALLSPAQFTTWWNGSPGTDGVNISFESGKHFECIQSYFGLGVLTFSFPYLFQTPHGINLWVRGPANWCRDGIQALEGIVETDWTIATFTMNWKLTHPNQEVHFEIGDPICVIIPFPRHFLEQFRPQVRKISSNPIVEQMNNDWQASRSHHLSSVANGALPQHAWQQSYYRGLDENGEKFSDHQPRISLAPFENQVSCPRDEN